MKKKQVNRFALLTSVKFHLVSLKTFYKRNKEKDKRTRSPEVFDRGVYTRSILINTSININI